MYSTVNEKFGSVPEKTRDIYVFQVNTTIRRKGTKVQTGADPRFSLNVLYIGTENGSKKYSLKIFLLKLNCSHMRIQSKTVMERPGVDAGT